MCLHFSGENQIVMDVLVFIGINVYCIDHKLVTGDQFLMVTAVLAAMTVLIRGDLTFLIVLSSGNFVMELSGKQHSLWSIYTSHLAIASPCTAGSYGSKWGCYGGWSLSYMLLLQVTEHVSDCHYCLNCP
jgi:hypothetical protein